MAYLEPSAPVAGMTTEPSHASYVDWGPIIAGAIVAAAISTLMTAFGAALGLTGVSPYSGQGLSANAIGIAAAIYVIWIVVSSFLVGGYLAGRLRRRIHDASEHESDLRDGSHGLIVWALGALMIAYIATSAIGGAVKAGSDVVAGGASVVGGAVKTLAQSSDPLNYTIDRLVRGKGQNAPNAEMRTDITRILANSVSPGTLSDEDKTYLTNQVAAAAGIPQEEATRRVNDAVAQVNALSDKAKQAAERARKAGIVVAFLTAASLAISAAAAWWAATLGGKHRDEGAAFGATTGWR